MNLKNFEAPQFHLREARDHIDKLITEIGNGEVDAIAFRFSMAHLYHHINSAWNTRHIHSQDDPLLREKFLEFSNFPSDIKPWEH